jgi:AraC family transcriptional regulator of adaptative response / DNA-3-methyladenine glycosylase II
MDLERSIYSKARRTRDPRFDGRFFIAVLSTGVYCRSICPAPTAKERNVRYFPTAAAAAEAGFRPCLRCRPECSPGTPGWMGTSTTVARALRLIGESPLADTTVEALANRLGIDSRHLRRLFLKHLGAAPKAVMQTRRLHFAKKLIDETTLPMSEIAVSAGFGSIRHFNSTIRQTYRRTPTQLRRIACNRATEPANEYLFRLRFRPPFQWTALLDFLRPRATPGVELVTRDSYGRTFSLGGLSGSVEVSLDDKSEALAVRIRFPDPRHLFLVIERIRGMFDLNADPAEIATQLSVDELLAPRIAAEPGLRVPGSWDGFELSVRAILGQQVTVGGATTLCGRLVQSFGAPLAAGPGLTHLFPSPEVLGDADLSTLGIPRARTETIRALARAVSGGHLTFNGVLDVNAFLARFREIPGIGDWTAQYVAMRALGEPDAFPSGDLGLLRATSLESSRELAERAEAWRPWRAYAAMYLWRRPRAPDATVRRIPRRGTGLVAPHSTGLVTRPVRRHFLPVVLPPSRTLGSISQQAGRGCQCCQGVVMQ